jgi:hypothetical protein
MDGQFETDSAMDKRAVTAAHRHKRVVSPQGLAQSGIITSATLKGFVTKSSTVLIGPH